MKIYGPYKGKDNRSRVIIIHDSGYRQSQSYPRFIMENYLGVVLDSKEDVHHIDENVDNNNISNLEILQSSNHRRKHSLKYKKPITVNCFYCGSKFELSTTRQSQRTRDVKRGKQGPFCSRSCCGKYGADVQRAAK